MTARKRRSTSRVPPPTRGWPRDGGTSDAGQDGSPAHAGMAPRSFRARRSRGRFPRPRGDGPRASLKFPWRSGVPPPTRGWPAGDGSRDRGAAGSPAHAGMAPASVVLPTAVRGFPRPRGDGPAQRVARRQRWRVPPPTRGWPGVQGRQAAQAWGSPAHAGMAPTASPSPPMPCGFPRPRGDGPRHDYFTSALPWVPPPTRGWPLCAGRGGRASDGSPAHAGMAPTIGSAGVPRDGFPRPLGDSTAFQRPT